MKNHTRAIRCVAAFAATSIATWVCTSALAADSRTIFYVDASGRVLRSDSGTISALAQGLSTAPDGIALDTADRHVYWTNMGKAGDNDGSIMRADYDGKNIRTIVAAGDAFTPKQIKVDVVNSKLYWSDREGMRIMRANLDGSYLETLVETGRSETDRQDQSRWCVGIAIDVAGNKLYWTQNGGGNGREGVIKRAALELPPDTDPAKRSDVEVVFAGLSDPTALELDTHKRFIYWSDRDGTVISRAPMDAKTGFDPAKRADRETVATGLQGATGIVLDSTNGRMYYTTLGGVVGVADLDRKSSSTLLSGQGALSGIALAE